MVVRMQSVEPGENLRGVWQRLPGKVIECGGHATGVDLVYGVGPGLEACIVIGREEERLRLVLVLFLRRRGRRRYARLGARHRTGRTGRDVFVRYGDGTLRCRLSVDGIEA